MFAINRSDQLNSFMEKHYERNSGFVLHFIFVKISPPNWQSSNKL